mgnify:CR=1 FL=1
MKRLIPAACLLLAVLPAQARIEAPDHILYGNVTLYGDPVAPGQVVEARFIESGEVIARYELGSDPDLGEQYALRFPMDAIDPRTDGRARPGDPVRVYVGQELAAEAVVGSEGEAVRLDIDPQNLGTGPSVDVGNAELFEGNAGQQAAEFAVEMNTTSDDTVEVDWTTVDGTATGASSCADGVDFISQASTLFIPPGETTATISVPVCGDTEIEPVESFTLSLAARRGVLTAAARQVSATIIDDDDTPTLQLADVVVSEPLAGAAGEAVFTPRLSKNSGFESRFDYRVEAVNAVEGIDYRAVSGRATIASGDVATEIRVPVLHNPATTSPRSFRLLVSDPFNVGIEDSDALGVVQDPGFEPAVEREQAVVNRENGLTRLSGPTALALSPDGRHAYATSDSENALVAFRRNAVDGSLQLIAEYDAAEGPLDVVVSGDGAHVYVAGSRADAVWVFARNDSTGALAPVQQVADSDPGVDGLGGVRKLLLSREDDHLYAAGAGDNAVAVFRRDAADGTLAFVENEANGVDDPDDLGDEVRGMRQPAGLAFDPDGRTLYVAARGGDAVQVFDRVTDESDPDFGRLAFRTAYSDGLDGISGLDGPLSIGVSGDGNHLYVSIEDGNGVWWFDRAVDGSLTQRRDWRHDSTRLPGLRGAQGLAISPDGLELFVAGFGDDSLTIFERMQSGNEDGLPAGDLRLRQTVFDDAGAVLNMAGPTAVVPSGDDEHLYVVANEDNAIVVFRRISLDEVFSNDFE